MKIRCHKVYSATTGEDLSKTSESFTVGKDYIVLAIKVEREYGIYACVLTDQYQTTFRNLVGFEVISNKIPEHWDFQIDHGIMYLMPKSWMGDTFLDDVDDQVPQALEVFYNEVDIAYALEGDIFVYDSDSEH